MDEKHLTHPLLPNRTFCTNFQVEDNTVEDLREATCYGCLREFANHHELLAAEAMVCAKKLSRDRVITGLKDRGTGV